MAQSILILNGPNLNLLGAREPELYGHDTLADVEARCRALAEDAGAEISFFQSNHEGEIVDQIQQAEGQHHGIIINPAAYSHTSIAFLDALKFYSGLVVEVHISNIFRRESFRHHSYVSLRADAVMAGFGAAGYELALSHLLTALDAD